MSIAVDGRQFVDRTGQPFLWLADTAWNVALRDDEPAWAEYLDARAEQGFTVIQFVATQWRGCSRPVHGPVYETKGNRLVPNEAAFAKLDRWMQMIDDRGLIAAPVTLWANTPSCPGQALSEAQCVTLGKFMLDRWSQHPAAWLLAGDGDYRSSEVAERWKRIGRAVFADHPEAVATMHPAGLMWIADLFSDEPWYGFAGIQSGHGSDEHSLRFLQSESYATRWRDLKMPFVNLEPNYEQAIAYGTDDRFTDYHVRRAAYWSLLVAPPAGVTYGTNPIWIWAQQDGETAEGHGDFWKADHWRSGFDTPGTASMSVIRAIFERLPWPELRPGGELLFEQPGEIDPNRFIAVAATEDRSTVVVYTPTGDRAVLGLKGAIRAEQIDPRTGEGSEAALEGSDHGLSIAPPDSQDWLYVLRL
jgi:hypothetical protein